ncbi:MAG: hypothetical protein R2873_30105 [Caldilineaceae bacterium]
MLVHLLNGISPDPLGDFEAINQEMLLFNPGLRERPQLVVFNKMDLPEARRLAGDPVYPGIAADPGDGHQRGDR